MKRLLSIIVVFIGFTAILHAADTLKIVACDHVAVNIFNDMVCLSSQTGELRRYVDYKLLDSYQGDKRSSQPLLQEPKLPVFDGADKIYLLDAGTNNIIGWDRFLNVYSITPLNDDLVSPESFTVTSEHDWLIYDAFYSQILQVSPREDYYTDWGDKPVSGDIELYSIGEFVIIHMIDLARIRIADVNGTTLKEYDLPKTIDIKGVIPLKDLSFALTGPAGVDIWEPSSNTIRHLSNMKNIIYCQKMSTGYRLVSGEGVVITDL